MPDLPMPETPVEQQVLRELLEAMAIGSGGSVRCDHEDRFWRSENGREAVYGWGTAVASVSAPARVVQVWFDGLDRDISLWTGSRGQQWREWRDLTDMRRVLREVEEEILLRLTSAT